MSEFNWFWVNLERGLLNVELEGIRTAKDDATRQCHFNRGMEVRRRLERVDPGFRGMLQKRRMEAEKQQRNMKQEYRREFDKGLQIQRDALMMDIVVRAQATIERSSAEKAIAENTINPVTTRPPKNIFIRG